MNSLFLILVLIGNVDAGNGTDIIYTQIRCDTQERLAYCNSKAEEMKDMIVALDELHAIYAAWLGGIELDPNATEFAFVVDQGTVISDTRVDRLQ